jgi:hypothetical protein
MTFSQQQPPNRQESEEKKRPGFYTAEHFIALIGELFRNLQHNEALLSSTLGPSRILTYFETSIRDLLRDPLTAYQWESYLEVISSTNFNFEAAIEIYNSFQKVRTLSDDPAVFAAWKKVLAWETEKLILSPKTTYLLIEAIPYLSSGENLEFFDHLLSLSRASKDRPERTLAVFVELMKAYGGNIPTDKSFPSPLEDLEDFCLKFHNDDSYATAAGTFLLYRYALHTGQPPSELLRDFSSAFEYNVGSISSLGRSPAVFALQSILSPYYREYYRTKDWNDSALVANLVALSYPRTLALRERKDTRIEFLMDFAPVYIKRGRTLEALAHYIKDLPEEKIKQLRSVFEKVAASGLSIELLPPDQSKIVNVTAWKFFEALITAVYFKDPAFNLQNILPKIHQTFEALEPHTKSMAPYIMDFVEKFTQSSEPDGVWKAITDCLDDIQEKCEKIHFEKKILDLLRESDDVKLERLAKKIGSEIYADSPPYSLEDENGNRHPDMQRVLSETRRVMYRAYELSYGFGALTYEARRIGKNSTWLLKRFGEDAFNVVFDVFTKHMNKFPGHGTVLSGLNESRVFALDLSAIEHGGDPLHLYKDAWPWAANEFDDLQNTTYTFTRGFIAVTHPNTKYSIAGRQLSYIVFNEHFYGAGMPRAILAPSEVLGDLLMPSLQNRSLVRLPTDANDIMKSPAEFLAKFGDRYIDVTSASNLGGGLCNAFLPGSEPFHEWERYRQDETHDTLGHVHKSHILGGYQSTMTTELDEALKPLRVAHDEVYRVTTAYQNLFDLFRLAHTFWHTGQTSSNEPDDDGETEAQPLETADSTELQINPHSYRMLHQAYVWFKEFGQIGKDEKEQCPVLCSAYALDYWNHPSAEITLDTYSMELRVSGDVYQLPQVEKLDDEGRLTWISNVLPLLDGIKDLRFYNRNVLE